MIDSFLLGIGIVLGKKIVDDNISQRQDKVERLKSQIQYNTESVLEENDSNLLLDSSSTERYNRNIIPDALALSCDIYAICSKKQSCSGFHTKSFSTAGHGWVYLKEFLKYPDYDKGMTKAFIDFCNAIKNLKYIDEIKIDEEKPSGLGSGVFFQYINDQLIRIAYVTKGTASMKDIGTDIEQGLKASTRQYNLSKENAIIINKRMRDYLGDSAHLYFFGHSLGGGLANFNAIATKNPAITFNAASLHPDNVALYANNYNQLVKKNSMIGVYVTGEMLSTEMSSKVGLPKNGNRYRVGLDTKYYKKEMNLLARHFLEPLCTKYALKKINNWNHKIFLEI